MLFPSSTHREVWLDHHCRRCFQPDEANRRLLGANTQCPIQEKALRTGRKPPEWDRNPRATLMQEAFKCNAYTAKPTKTKPDKQFEDIPMFDDIFPEERIIVPVEGWPDRPPKKGTDHA